MRNLTQGLSWAPLFTQAVLHTEAAKIIQGSQVHPWQREVYDKEAGGGACHRSGVRSMVLHHSCSM